MAHKIKFVDNTVSFKNKGQSHLDIKKIEKELNNFAQDFIASRPFLKETINIYKQIDTKDVHNGKLKHSDLLVNLPQFKTMEPDAETLVLKMQSIIKDTVLMIEEEILMHVYEEAVQHKFPIKELSFTAKDKNKPGIHDYVHEVVDLFQNFEIKRTNLVAPNKFKYFNVSTLEKILKSNKEVGSVLFKNFLTTDKIKSINKDIALLGVNFSRDERHYPIDVQISHIEFTLEKLLEVNHTMLKVDFVYRIEYHDFAKRILIATYKSEVGLKLL